MATAVQQEQINPDPLGRTPEYVLLDAVKRGDVDAARVVIESGIDLNRKLFPKKSYLRIAGEAGCRRMCELLVRHGADPNEVNGVRQHSLMHTAAIAMNFGFASILLDIGAEPSPRTSSGSTPLHIAARTDQEFLAIKLIRKGANRSAQDNNGRTPFDLAAEKGNDDLAAVLERVGPGIRLDSAHFPKRV